MVGVSNGWGGGWQAQDPTLQPHLSTDGLVNSTGEFYLRAIYWSSVVLVTVGFGDIIPTQLNEMLVTVANAMFEPASIR